MSEGGTGGGSCPPDFGSHKAPPGSGGAPHYYLPPQIFRIYNMLELCSLGSIKDDLLNRPYLCNKKKDERGEGVKNRRF
jgi:hypothetical protein